MIRAFKTEGIVIKRINFGEADRILTILTKYNGKVQVKAPGVRKITSKRSSHIELLNLSFFTLYKSSRSLFPIVTEAQTLENFSLVKENLEKIGYAYYICELINGLCPDNQENRNAFFLLKKVLVSLENNNKASLVVSYFEKELLRILGFWKEAVMLEAYGSRQVMESLLERKLNTPRVFPLFASC